MIENGMIVGAESWDPQCQDIECSRCSVCKQWVPDNEITEFFGGDKVCKECIGDYLIKNSAEFEEPFVKEHLPEYVREWWKHLMYQMGFRITYVPDLENSWNAISGTASWVSVIVSVLGVIASFLAVWSAIQVPKKIAERQIKVGLFEKRYRVYRTLILCDSFSALVSISTGLADIEIFFLSIFL